MSSKGPLDPPAVIGPYHVIQVIGEGGMGVVFEAEQRSPVRRRVAVKMMKAGLDTKEVIGRFEAERQALAVMEHPGIAKVFDAGATVDRRPYFAMELVRGVPLMDYCAQHRLDTRSRVELFTRVCDAVQHAHQKGVIHRDLKPKNILVEEQNGHPHPKVIDFGVAKATGQRLSEHTVVTTYGQALGTLAYMSPEQAEMSGLDVDTRTDIYSLGVTLHELVVGKVPLDPYEIGPPQFIARLLEPDLSMPSLTERLNSLDPSDHAKVIRRHGTTLEKLRREVAGDLQWIVLRAMEKERSRRYQTVNGLAMDLRRFLAHEPVVARPPSAAYRAAKFVRRHRVGVGVTGAISLLVVGFAAAMAIQARTIALERDRTALQAQKAQEVSDFMKGLFASADPNVVAGDTLTARELLRRGVERIEEELADQPELRADLRREMGDAHLSLGLIDDAEALYEASLADGRSALGDTSAIVATALANLGTIARDRGDWARAEALEREGLSIRRALFGDRSASVAQSMNGLAMVLSEQGDYQAAADLAGEALELRLEHFPEESIEVAQTINNLAQVMHNLEQLDSAEVLYRRSLSIRREMYGNGHPLVATALNNLGLFHRERGNLDAAEPLLREALTIRRSILGSTHPRLVPVINNLAGVLRMKGDLAGAEPLYIESLELRQALYGEVHPRVMIGLNNIAVFYRTKGDLELSIDYWEQVVDVGRRVYPAGHPTVAEGIRNYGATLLLAGRPEEAEGVLVDSRASYAALFSEDDYRTMRAQGDLARSYTHRGMYTEAERLLLEAHTILGELHANRARDVERTNEFLVELYEAWGKPDEADRYRLP